MRLVFDQDVRASDDFMPELLQYYWVIPGRFAAGEYPGSVDEDEAVAKVAQLIGEQIDYFIDLTQEHELLPYAHLLTSGAGAPAAIVVTTADAAANGSVARCEHLRRSICDMNVPSREEMVVTLDAIDGALCAGRKLYIHCWGGVGRTGTVVGCWFRRHGCSATEALARVAALFGKLPKSAYRKSPETEAQCAFVREWNEAGSGGDGDPVPQSIPT